MMLHYYIIPLICIHLLLIETSNNVVDARTEESFLQGFYTRSLFRTDSSMNVLEVEETYDSLRGLGKLVLHSPKNGPSVLYSRSNGPLYLDVQYSHDEIITGCSGSSINRIGGFHLFNDMQEVWPEMRRHVHLIGPASLLYLFRKELLDYQQTTKEFGNETTDTRRLILDPRPININKNVIFKRAGFIVERAPLLQQLAAYMEFKSSNQTYYVDFLDIQQFDTSQYESSVVFKMPTVLLCSEETISGLLRNSDSVELKAIGSSVELKHYWVDFPRNHPQTHQLVLDFERNLLQVEVEDRWTNVIDMKSSLLFHKSLEQSPLVQYKTDILATTDGQSEQVRNSECSIMTSSELASYKSMLGGSISSRHLAFYTGSFKSNIYLGIESNYQGRGPAHVIELSFTRWQDLPTPIRMLEPPFPEDSNSACIGKLFIAAVDSCGDLYKDPTRCKNPLLLGFELYSLDRKVVGSVIFHNFKWHISETQVASLNLDTCPLEKLKLLLEISSTKENLEDPELDKLVLERMLDYMSAFSGKYLKLVSFQRSLGSYGFDRIAYSIELAENPELATRFEKSPKKVKKFEMSQVDGLYDVDTSQECLAWASQFGQSRTVLYSKKDADCLIYKLSLSQFLDPKNYTVGSYEIYSRKLERLIKTGSGIKLFLKENFAQINDRMKLDNDDPTLKVKFLTLQALNEERVTTGEANTNMVVEKSKFAEIEQVSVLAFRDCSSQCQDTQGCSFFSYCINEELNQFCQLSDRTNFHDAKLQTDYNCEIHAKNYLHYFQSVPHSDLTHISKPQWRLLSDNIFKMNPQECARLCQLEDSCIRFVHCPTQGCFVWDEVSGKEMLGELSQCDSYKRKPSSFFKGTRFREQGEFMWTGVELHKAHLIHRNAEECAEKCITDSECISYDVCHLAPPAFKAIDDEEETTTTRLKCILLSGSVYQEPFIDELSPTSNTINDNGDLGRNVSKTYGCRHYERLSVAITHNLSELRNPLSKKDTIYNHLSFYFVNFIIASSLGILAGLILPNINNYSR